MKQRMKRNKNSPYDLRAGGGLLGLVNRAREDHGRKPLRFDAAVDLSRAMPSPDAEHDARVVLLVERVRRALGAAAPGVALAALAELYRMARKSK